MDEERMFKALAPFYDDLTPAEKKRNIRGDDRLYVGPGNKSFEFIKALYAEVFIAPYFLDFTECQYSFLLY